MKNIEIPYVQERDKVYRWFERLPGILSWLLLALPIILSILSPTVAAYFVIAYLLVWFIKTFVMNVRMVQGYRYLQQNMSYDWMLMLQQLDNPEEAFKQYEQGISPKWHYKNLVKSHLRRGTWPKSDDIYHVVIIAVYNETRDVVEPTIQSLLRSTYDMKRVFLFFAYEERGGQATEDTILALTRQYEHDFGSVQAIKHPSDIQGEVIGKGGNITYAGRQAQQFLSSMNIAPQHTIVTTLDSDNRPHPQYFAAVSYAFLACPDPIRASFQPISIFTNNIWDVPAPMRVVATGNSFWNIVLSLRPHMLRNFAAHSQSMQTLIDTDFWSVRTIVEDGHQFWRTYFRYNGNNEVYPILVPIYQDAVLSSKYMATLKAQFIQVRRWAWGASDVAYVLHTGWRHRNKVPKIDLFFKTARLIEGHVSWATAPLLLLLGAFVPLYLSPQADSSLIANQLPIIASRIQTVAMVGLFVSIYLSIRLLPPKPARYKKHKNVFMILQWVLLPVTTILYSSFAAINSQTRLIFGKYLGKFDVTEKAVKK